MSADVGVEYTGDIVFSDTGSGNYVFNGSGSGTGYEIEISGNLSGTLNETLNFVGSNGAGKEDFAYRITGNNSTLSRTQSGTIFGNNGAFLRTGHLILDNANALGLGNNFNFGLGQNNSNYIGSTVGLYATDGNDVSGDIYILDNSRAAGSRTGRVTVGLDGAGEVEFSGNIGLAGISDNNRNLNNLHLTADSGSRVNFSGQIFDSTSTTPMKVALIIEGGGTVAFSHGDNTYGGTGTYDSFGGTSITADTTLLVNGGEDNLTTSGTGTGMVRVGYKAVSTTADTTSGSAIVTVASTEGLQVGQAVSGTGIEAGTTISRINTVTTPGGVINTIQLSKQATASGSDISFDAAATTGILGGTGRIRPGDANSIIVASGSSIAAGDGGIGTLTFDGGDTTANLLTMESGSIFSFDLGAGNASDEIALWNYVVGDLGLNNNIVNFEGAQEGSYTLFSFYSDSGSTMTASGIADGLVIGTGLDGFAYTLNYNTNSITLDVVPEPSVAGLLMGTCVGLLCLRRKKRA
ncbi:PEP-CTERM sorting domain-containing protein [Coraliomargarita algicola]|uniref:PEP-CTERM sorting domain-containing protein n=1 Tax=Coraliomargarita algicola TaxID=3092156 RepID=A0ABZ0RKL1_9BACT|nr:PEP-CTERM sorting domain-containing protein [Coraliomargarita sp. J2-16]WPJ95623.1 PEP-CTERM sorting domain-containing protein [Coraliomargarita sp. J2-16]